MRDQLSGESFATILTIRCNPDPRHLREMYVRQIHSFAALIQSNVRVMLARNATAYMAGQKKRVAHEKREERRNRAALRIQAFFLLFLNVMRRRRGKGKRVVYTKRIQRAWRCHLARSSLSERSQSR
jgi:hypothetical protein